MFERSPQAAAAAAAATADVVVVSAIGVGVGVGQLPPVPSFFSSHFSSSVKNLFWKKWMLFEDHKKSAKNDLLPALVWLNE